MSDYRQMNVVVILFYLYVDVSYQVEVRICRETEMYSVGTVEVSMYRVSCIEDSYG